MYTHQLFQGANRKTRVLKCTSNLTPSCKTDLKCQALHGRQEIDCSESAMNCAIFDRRVRTSICVLVLVLRFLLCFNSVSGKTHHWSV